MPILSISGKQVDVDIESELRNYPWGRERWTSDKLIACSPFRHEARPSFFVNLETGGWADSGATIGEDSGNFTTLLGYLRGAGEGEACDYLIDKYGALYDFEDTTKPLRIKSPKITDMGASTIELSGDTITSAVSPYITKRGISAEVQRMFSIGYGEGHEGFTAIPWHTVDDRLANVKYRSTSDKRFFYERDATAVKTLVYGIDVAEGKDEVVIVEGEIDALSWWTAGIPAIAIGSAHMSDEQADLVRQGGFKRIYLGGDNDKQGRQMNELVARKLRGYAELFEVDYGKEKDANDVLLRHGARELVEIKARTALIRTIHVRV